MQKILNQFNQWFFYGFLLTFTLTIRKVIFLYPINREFNEYTGIYLYLSDIFLILTIFTWIALIILYNNISSLSIYNFFLNKKVYIPFLLVIWCFISISWSDNKNIALFRSIKLLECYFLYIYLLFNVSRLSRKLFHMEHFYWDGTFLKKFTAFLIIIGSIQALVGFIQFFIQHSIGLTFLRESIVSRGTIGVAKIILDGEKYIRAYGLFPHPNILGGFLLMTIILTLLYRKMFHVEQSQINNQPSICSMWNKYAPKILNLALSIQIIGIILTFSKSSLIGLILTLIFLFYLNYKQLIVSRLSRKLFHVEQFFWGGTIIRKVILTLLILFFSVIVFKPDFYSFLIKPLNERLVFQDVSRGTILANPVLGVGIGQFVLNMQNYTNYTLENWQYQPVHNIFLLIWSELGIVGLFIFVFWIFKMFHVKQKRIDVPPQKECSTWNILRGKRGTFNIYLKSILIGFIFIMLFDHYLWDIQQGQFLLWITLGLLASEE